MARGDETNPFGKLSSLCRVHQGTPASHLRLHLQSCRSTVRKEALALLKLAYSYLNLLVDFTATLQIENLSAGCLRSLQRLQTCATRLLACCSIRSCTSSATELFVFFMPRCSFHAFFGSLNMLFVAPSGTRMVPGWKFKFWFPRSFGYS